MELLYSESQILNGRNTDKFFFDYSTEDLDNNLLILGQLHFFGNHLTKKLDEKLKYRKENLRFNYLKYKEFVGSIKYYSLLAQGLTVENYYYYQGDEETFEKDYKTYKDKLISNFENNYLPQFTLEKLVESYLENDVVTYKKQSVFFKIDIDVKPEEIINKKDKLENLPDFNSYNYIYDLLLKHIQRYKPSNLDWFTEMGMSLKQKAHCDEFYTKKLRNRSLTDTEIKNLLKSSIVKLIETVFF